MSYLGLRRWLPALALASCSQMALADNNIDSLNFSSQGHFETFAESLTNILGHKTAFPAEPLGTVGFDIGASLNLVDSNIKLSDQSQKDRSYNVYSLHANKGLPGGIDLALNYNQLENSSASSWNAQLKYALVEGGTAYPAVAVSGHMTQASGMKAVDFSSYGLDLSISKGLANVTPYAGIGWVLANVDPKVDNTPSLKSEDVSVMSYHLGANFNLMLMDVLVGYQQTGELGSFMLKAGYRF